MEGPGCQGEGSRDVEGRGVYLLSFTIIFEIRSLALLETSLKCFAWNE